VDSVQKATEKGTPVITEQMMNEGESITQGKARVSGNVSAGYVNGYLEEAGDYDLYSVTIPSGYMLQAQLAQPASSEMDYDSNFAHKN
jgi:hypothetical protein